MEKPNSEEAAWEVLNERFKHENSQIVARDPNITTVTGPMAIAIDYLVQEHGYEWGH